MANEEKKLAEVLAREIDDQYAKWLDAGPPNYEADRQKWVAVLLAPHLERAERCGNCDHHSDLHNADGCIVRIQKEDGKRYSWMVDCPCKWNKSQASDLPAAPDTEEKA